MLVTSKTLLDGPAFAQEARAHLDAARASALLGLTAPPLRRAAVIGAGAMGAGIASALVQHGLSVKIFDRDPAASARALEIIRADVAKAASRGRLDRDEAELRLAGAVAIDSMRALGDVEIAIEAAFEDMAVKQAVMGAIDAALPEDAILASNTSTLDLDAIAQATRRPQQVVGAHFFMPAQVTGLVEIVRGRATSEDTLARTKKLASQLGKLPVVARVGDGFIGNRMFDRFWREAMFMIEEGATPVAIDGALERWGFAIGPLRALDMIGADLPWRTIRARAATKHVGRQPLIYDLLCEAGRLGQKCGRGWHAYAPGERRPLPDDDGLRPLIEAARTRQGLTAREITDEEIVGRCVFALANEGARLLEENIAETAADVDLISVVAYGFPAERGGPLFFTEHFGPSEALACFDRYARLHGDAEFWRPAPLLEKMRDGAASR